jgi:hypothetical protein
MKWLDNWLYGKVRDMWDNSHKYQTIQLPELKMASGGQLSVDRGAPEGEDRINFELSSAVGGRILNVRRYDTRTDRHNQTTYVIPTGEDIGQRVAKIINLELIK